MTLFRHPGQLPRAKRRGLSVGCCGRPRIVERELTTVGLRGYRGAMRVENKGSHSLLIAVVLLAGLALPGGASAACTPDATLAKYDDETAMFADGGGAFVQNTQWPAQSFTILNPDELGTVSLFMQNLAPAGDSVTVEVRSDVIGLPGTVLGQATASTTNTASYEWLDFDFSSLGVQLAAGTPYWIVASSTVAANGQGYGWQEASPATVNSNGISRNTMDQGGSWGGALNWDQGFRVFSCAPPPAPLWSPPPRSRPTRSASSPHSATRNRARRRSTSFSPDPAN